MKYPDFLHANGTIGFAAPSFGCNMDPYKAAFNNALDTFKKMGYKTHLGPNCYAGEGIGISNTPIKCGEELTDMYLSPQNDVLMSCGGGELMCEILDFVDFEQIAASKPKWFMGYSDNTNFTFTLATLCDTAAIYAPCAPSFGMEPWHTSIQDAFNIITGKSLTVQSYDLWETESLKDEEHPLQPYNTTEPMKLKLYSDEDMDFSGRLLGGCMDCLINLTGTKYDKVTDYCEKYKDDGIVWFLEACDLNVFGIRRALWQIEHAGWFKHVRGFIIGRPMHFGEEMMGLNHYDAAYEVLKKYNVPVVLDADLGHLPPMMPLIVGSCADVHVRTGRLKIDMKLI